MKIGRWLRLAVLIGAAALIYRVFKQYQADSSFELAPVSNTGTSGAALNGSERRSVSPELLEILACPVDKKPVELISDASGKEWLLNPRNGYRYPIEDGIPIMLIEEGEKHKDESLIRSA
jgi:uncharacterized protein